MKKLVLKMKNNLNFKWKASDVVSETEKLISSHQIFVDELVKVSPENQSFDTIVKPLAFQEAHFSNISRNITFFQNVSSDKELRDASSKAEKEITNYVIDLYTREDLFEILENVKKKENELDEIDKRYIEYTLRSFRRNGLGRKEEEREEIKKIKKQIADYEVDFSKNITEAKPEFTFTREELDGCGDDFINGLKKDEKDETKYILNLKYPHRSTILTYCKVPSTRKKIDDEYQFMVKENPKLYEETVHLRNKFSKLLGFEDYPGYELDIRMAKTAEKVKNFLSDLTGKLEKKGKEELMILRKMKKEELGLDELPEIESHDFYYYCDQRKKKEMGIDDDLVKQFFPVDHVIKMLLEIFQSLLGLRYEKAEGYENVWHEEVLAYNVYESETNDFIGTFYMDLFPREGKYNHFCFCSLQSCCLLSDGTVQYPIGAVLCNFSRETPGKPSLLRHTDVETFFHEFGHLMHHMCSKTKYMKFSGTKVERDFVEFPSQMMENWVYNYDMLKKISSHYQTKEPLSDEIIQKILQARKLNKGLFTLRQLFFGTFDIESYFQEKEEQQRLDSQKLYNSLRKKVSLVAANPETNGVNAFGHLMGGYSCGYFSYLWSEVYSFDAFSLFEKAGLTNTIEVQKVGKMFREIVLQRGSEKDGLDIITEFLGRSPQSDAFLLSLGMKKKEEEEGENDDL